MQKLQAVTYTWLQFTSFLCGQLMQKMWADTLGVLTGDGWQHLLDHKIAHPANHLPAGLWEGVSAEGRS